MELTKLTNNEILLKIDAIGEKKGVKLRFSHKLFYVSLLRLAENEGKYSDCRKLYFVDYSITEFVKSFKLSRSTVSESLKLLKECDLIDRDEHERSFRKVSDSKYVTNKGWLTYLNISTLELDIKYED